MLIYWLLFLIPAFLALSGEKRDRNPVSRAHPLALDGFWIIAILLLTIIIGLRYQVGGDWHTYLLILSRSEGEEFSILRDPGYAAMNKFSTYIGLGIYGVNILCGFIFSVGLGLFCKSLPRPLLALSVAMPYLVIVVAMGYSRQAVSLGLCMIGLAYLGRGNLLRFIFFIIVSITIHKSSMILLPVAALAATKNKVSLFISMFSLSIIIYIVFLAETFDIIYRNYVEVQQQSQGAFIRLAMNALPAFIFLALYKKFDLEEQEGRIWKWFSYVSILLFLLFFLTDASTALDRIALYAIPIQLVVFSYLPDIFKIGGHFNKLIILVIIFYYFLTLFVWLNFAAHSNKWIPYDSLLSQTIYSILL